MREVAIVVVDSLHVHRVPGNNVADILPYDLKKGDRFDVLERDSSRQRAEWIRMGKGEWVAEYNKVTGERFCNVTKASDRPGPPSYPIPPSHTEAWPWVVGAAAFGLIIVLVLMYT